MKPLNSLNNAAAVPLNVPLDSLNNGAPVPLFRCTTSAMKDVYEIVISPLYNTFVIV